MLRFLQSWCPLITVVLVFLLIQFWLQLLRWKNWSVLYQQWVNANCQCQAPGGSKPTEPTWP
jgi:hypothetical protein